MCACLLLEVTPESEHWKHFKLHAAVFVQEIFVINTCQAFIGGEHPQAPDS